MKRILPYLVAAAVVVWVGTTILIAGEGHAECTASTEACLNAKAAQYAEHGWLGVETEADHGRYVVTVVEPDSPGYEAGFQTGDVLLALNGVPLKKENKAALKKAKSMLGVGKEITYTVLRDGSKQTLTATLAPVPHQVLAQWVGQHMLEHHVTVTLAQAD